MGSAAPRAPSTSLLTFSTTYSTVYGDRVYVCGSTPELGGWDVSRAVPLHWHANDIWSARVGFTPPAPSAPARLEYKFLVADAASPDPAVSSRQPLWEPGENHALDIAADTPRATLPHAWGDAVSHDIPPGQATSAGARSSLAIAAASPPPTPAPAMKTASRAPGDPVTLAVERLASSTSNGASAVDSVTAGEEKPAVSTLPSVAPQIPVVFRVGVPSRNRHSDAAIYIVGSCPALGSWNKAHSPRMRPVVELRSSAQRCDAVDEPHDSWQISMTMPADEAHKRFEYKYLVRERGRCSQRLWEPGPNRVGTISGDASLTEMIWDDRWDRVRCEFSIFYPTQDHCVLHVTGDPPEIGAWFKPGPVPMELGAIERLETDVDGRKWRLVVWLPRSMSSFAYRYILVDSKTKTLLWEREPNRHADFKAVRTTKLSNSGKSNGWPNGHVVTEGGASACGDAGMVSAGHPDTVGSAQSGAAIEAGDAAAGLGSDAIKKRETLPDNGVYYLRDVNFVTSMKFDAVPPNMFIGPYPQTPADVDCIAEAGATAVFNVQTDEDFKHRGIKWSELMQRYNERNMEVVRFPIRDFDGESLEKRLHGAAHELDRLISGGKTVYIHCTAGMGRAPACAVAYLCWARGYDLEDAVRHVKKHRPVAVPNVPVLEKVLKRPF